MIYDTFRAIQSSFTSEHLLEKFSSDEGANWIFATLRKGILVAQLRKDVADLPLRTQELFGPYLALIADETPPDQARRHAFLATAWRLEKALNLYPKKEHAYPLPLFSDPLYQKIRNDALAEGEPWNSREFQKKVDAWNPPHPTTQKVKRLFLQLFQPPNRNAELATAFVLEKILKNHLEKERRINEAEGCLKQAGRCLAYAEESSEPNASFWREGAERYKKEAALYRR